MGKKAKLKQLRKLAATMPAIEGERLVTKRAMGIAVIEEGIKHVDGKAIDPNAIYRKSVVEKVNVNHNRKMKDLYNKKGIEGVNGYVKAVAQYAASQTQAN
jgi:hypothetical protein